MKDKINKILKEKEQAKDKIKNDANKNLSMIQEKYKFNVTVAPVIGAIGYTFLGSIIVSVLGNDLRKLVRYLYMFYSDFKIMPKIEPAGTSKNSKKK